MLISAIVPVHNAKDSLPRCLAALRASAYRPFELVVVDDASTDGSAVLAREFADQVIAFSEHRGAGAARDAGAAASGGEILFFVDADVEVRPDTISRIAGAFSADAALSGVFGSYDASPAAQDIISQYKNLYHHFVHQTSAAEAQTFWAGCGALRRPIFFEAGGFGRKWRTSAIEDVALGYKVREKGGRIRLMKDLQVKHLKRWRLGSMVRTDIFQRAVPWTELSLKRGLPRDLNFKVSDRVSAVFAWSVLLSSAAFNEVGARVIFAVSGLAILYMNRRVLIFIARRRGGGAGVAAVFLHWLYFLYSSSTFLVSAFVFLWRRVFKAS